METTLTKRKTQSIFAQEPLEIGGFAYLLGKHNCTSYLEIGSRFGGSLLQTCALMDRVVSVDAASGQGKKEGSEQHLKNNLKKLSKLGVNTTFIKGWSTDEQTIKQVAEHGPFDAIFIDAAHDYESVTKDFNSYKSMATKLIGFHDIIGKTRGKHILEVHILWDKLKQQYTTIELVDDQGEMGIGVIIL